MTSVTNFGVKFWIKDGTKILVSELVEPSDVHVHVCEWEKHQALASLNVTKSFFNINLLYL